MINTYLAQIQHNILIYNIIVYMKVGQKISIVNKMLIVLIFLVVE